MLVLFRGHGFRYGDLHHVADTFTGSKTLDEQLAAMDSAQKYLIEPLTRSGWNIEIAVDVFVEDDKLSELFQQKLTKLFNDPWLFTDHHLPFIAYQRKRAPTTDPVTGIRDGLSWAMKKSSFYSNKTMPAELDKLELRFHGAVMFARVDMFYKQEVALPTPSEAEQSNTVLTLSSVWSRSMHVSKMLRVVDVMLFIPPRAVAAALEGMSKPGKDLHDSIKRFLGLGTLYFSAHDSDPYKDWNPFYRLVGRPAKKYQAEQDLEKLDGAARLAFETMLADAAAGRVAQVALAEITLVQNENQWLDHERSVEVRFLLPSVPYPKTRDDTDLAFEVHEGGVDGVFPSRKIVLRAQLGGGIPGCLDRRRVETRFWEKGKGSELTIRAPLVQCGAASDPK